jgi:type III restriction enzyme
MLREGWDVQNVTVIVGLRPYTAKANILPEQTIGRGLRRMFAGQSMSYIERVDVIGNPAFLSSSSSWSAMRTSPSTPSTSGPAGHHDHRARPREGIPRHHGAGPQPDLGAQEDPRGRDRRHRCQCDDVSALPKKQDDKAAQQFRYEGVDIVTLQKIVERDYTIPQPQTSEEVISYYAKRIAQDVKLPSQFASLVPKVREFLRDRAFGETVDLADTTIIRAIATPIAQYVTVKTFAECCARSSSRSWRRH